MKPQEAAQNNQSSQPQSQLHHPAGQNAVRDLSGKDISISYTRTARPRGEDVESDIDRISSFEKTRSTYGLPPVVLEFVDHAVSGTTILRDGYQRMKIAGAENRGATIIVDRIDRVVRNVATARDFIDFLLENELGLYDSQGRVAHEVLLGEIALAGAGRAFVSGRLLKSDGSNVGDRS